MAGHNPDILTCRANLSADEVFTPSKLEAAVLDILSQDVFRRPGTTFLDPVCQSGTSTARSPVGSTPASKARCLMTVADVVSRFEAFGNSAVLIPGCRQRSPTQLNGTVLAYGSGEPVR